MVVSEQLKKQIIIEIIALMFLIGVILYTFFVIGKNNTNSVTTQDGMVIVVDDSKYEGMFICSDGKGLEKNGINYTLTNNNSVKVKYKVVVIPDIKDEDVLSMIRVSVDDLYIESLIDLEKAEGGYVLMEDTLGVGFTDINLFKFWYKLDGSEELLDKKISYKFKLLLDKKIDNDIG